MVLSTQEESSWAAFHVISPCLDRQFLFPEIKKSEINQEMLNLDSSKACQESDLPTKTIKANSVIFTEVAYKELNKALEVGNFSCTIKQANITTVYKTRQSITKR